jgi:rubrerythrin
MRLPAARRGCTFSSGSQSNAKTPPPRSVNWFKSFWKALREPAVAAGMSPPELAANLSPRAQQALALALRETERFNHNFVGTEHVLLGLIGLGQGIAVNVLRKMGVDLETVRKEVENQVGRGPGQKATGAIPYTPRVKKVLALAAKEARGLNHTYVGTEHLLLGLLREGDGVAARVLRNLDVDIEQTRREILKELDPNFTEAAEESLVAQKCSAMPTNPTINRATYILQGYYRRLAEEIAQDIIRHESDFVSSGFSEADSVLDRHSRRLWDLSQVFHHLARYTRGPKPEARGPLQRHEFRCFGCGGVIRPEDEACPSCGWTWRLL